MMDLRRSQSHIRSNSNGEWTGTTLPTAFSIPRNSCPICHLSITLTVDAELNASRMDDINITAIKAFISSFVNKAISSRRGICKIQLILLRKEGYIRLRFCFLLPFLRLLEYFAGFCNSIFDCNYDTNFENYKFLWIE